MSVIGIAACRCRRARSLPPLFLAVLTLLLGACAHAPRTPVAGGTASAVVSKKTEVLPSQRIRELLEPRGIAYRLGPGDVVAIGIYLHPDLSVPTSGAAAGRGPPGAVVSNGGNLQLPLLGVVHVAGLTVSGLRAKLIHAYRRYLKEPSISVQVQEARSIRYYLLGQFDKPGIKYSDRPLNLLEALALGGSIDLSDADLRGAYVLQGGHKLPLDFRRLLLDGDLNQNIALQSGDTIVVPSSASMRAYVFGAVAKPGPIAFVNGRLTLLQALSATGMDLTNLTVAKLRAVRVLRSSGTRGEYFVVDAARILEGRAAPFPLASGDIVFVPQTLVSTWNQALRQLLPSLQTIGAVLNPFVQIKFLRR
ncbi:polysaccharide biosynthesis/export protein [bacterium BMS3Abin12]|nr:polysaccharide biosynthesis/export protein [bacterium BMS3Abin12]